MDSIFSSLPDYPALKKLAAALWEQDSTFHGAAVMVGAGFSRAGASTGEAHRNLPLWHDFSRILAADLASNSTDPLRLAEEYDAYFGKQTLHELIKKEINDASWNPGELHHSLLSLPWTDILTTNWDTLLERASKDVHEPVYSVVYRQGDLSNARSPRIIKLHGTINVTSDLIFTQEEYRKYPQQHAAFVNVARQVFIENELCLLGFSGEDPNFLQWAGWVRDNLADRSRRIYLVGALELNAAKRRYLESINVAPVDLHDLVAQFDDVDMRHREATALFVKFLHHLKPAPIWEWRPANALRSRSENETKQAYNDKAVAARCLNDQQPALSDDRNSYPGWLIAPASVRRDLDNQIHAPGVSPEALSQMTPDNRAKLLYEVIWLHDKTYEVVPFWLMQELLLICDPDKPCVLSKKQQLEIAAALLKNTRWIDDAASLASAASAILEKGAKYWPESLTELNYYHAIVARDAFDYSALEEYVKKMGSLDPVWALRKAALLAELCEFEASKSLVEDAYRELLVQHRHDRHSLSLLSRLAWAHWIKRGIDRTSFKVDRSSPIRYQQMKCYPADHVDHLQRCIDKALVEQQKKQQIEPLFEPGRYRNNAQRIILRNELHPLVLFDRIAVTAGLPLRWKNIGFLGQQAEELAQMDEISDVHRIQLAIRAASSHTSPVLNTVFSRITMACMPQHDIDTLLVQCEKAIAYWSQVTKTHQAQRPSCVIERLGIFIEVMARVSVRATPEQAKQIFKLALSLCQNPDVQHDSLREPLTHLADFSLASIPQSEHQKVLLLALQFPLISEISIKGQRSRLGWVNPIIEYPGERPHDPALNRRIDEIIGHIDVVTPNHGTALMRMLPLLSQGFLTDAERQKIAKNVWGREPDYQTLPSTGLLIYVLLEIPSPHPDVVKERVREYLFSARGDDVFEEYLLLNLVNAAITESYPERPNAAQALDYFHRMVMWRPAKVDDFQDFWQDENERIGGLVGKALAHSIVPSLSPSALTEENFIKLLGFYNALETPTLLIALACFARENDFFASRVEQIIRQNLHAKEANCVAHASYALLAWREKVASAATARLIARLMFVIDANHPTGLQALLWTANVLLEKDYLSAENIDLLEESLPIIFDSAAYDNIPPASRESVSISFVRAGCVKLASGILKRRSSQHSELVRIVEKAAHDALPEVRFADSNDL